MIPFFNQLMKAFIEFGNEVHTPNSMKSIFTYLVRFIIYANIKIALFIPQFGTPFSWSLNSIHHDSSYASFFHKMESTNSCTLEGRKIRDKQKVKWRFFFCFCIYILFFLRYNHSCSPSYGKGWHKRNHDGCCSSFGWKVYRIGE